MKGRARTPRRFGGNRTGSDQSPLSFRFPQQHVKRADDAPPQIDAHLSRMVCSRGGRALVLILRPCLSNVHQRSKSGTNTATHGGITLGLLGPSEEDLPCCTSHIAAQAQARGGNTFPAHVGCKPTSALANWTISTKLSRRQREPLAESRGPLVPRVCPVTFQSPLCAFWNMKGRSSFSAVVMNLALGLRLGAVSPKVLAAFRAGLVSFRKPSKRCSPRFACCAQWIQTGSVLRRRYGPRSHFDFGNLAKNVSLVDVSFLLEEHNRVRITGSEIARGVRSENVKGSMSLRR